jgi:hypothetical protein
MKYKKGDLVLVQVSYDPRVPKEYAIVENLIFNSIDVKFIPTQRRGIYLKDFITPVTAESK